MAAVMVRWQITCEQKGFHADYYGFDILESAIEIARESHNGKPHCAFFTDKDKLPVCDYVVASGMFNVRGEQSFEIMDEVCH